MDDELNNYCIKLIEKYIYEVANFSNIEQNLMNKYDILIENKNEIFKYFKIVNKINVNTPEYENIKNKYKKNLDIDNNYIANNLSKLITFNTGKYYNYSISNKDINLNNSYKDGTLVLVVNYLYDLNLDMDKIIYKISDLNNDIKNIENKLEKIIKIPVKVIINSNNIFNKKNEGV